MGGRTGRGDNLGVKGVESVWVEFAKSDDFVVVEDLALSVANPKFVTLLVEATDGDEVASNVRDE